ncbi:MAG: 2-amino-4-hydroxy-6-hydroxymethyldihydropteridine diphosphokinase [Octadecabacter sp.]|nr:2-amino-4-hydroxy-6-hydroxymethyldihydropteridine diphosphokinase [Octadecabacter sp.]
MLQEAGRSNSSETALIALGANIGPHGTGPLGLAQTLRAAAARLGQVFGAVTLSRLYRTPCFPAGAGPDFVNAACAVQTDMQPEALLAQLHAIEAEFGRERTVRWGQRTLDLDLIACGDRILPDVATFRHWRDLPSHEQAEQAPDRLILPHPRLQDRAFVLVPLADIAAGWVHPDSGLTTAMMCDALPLADRAEVVAL